MARNAGTGRITWYRTLDELLPNVIYAEADKAGAPLTAAVIAGRVVSVQKGRAFDDSAGDGATSRRVSFDSPAADWKTVHVLVEATDQLPPNGKPVVTVGVAVNGEVDFAIVKRAFESLDRAVWFLEAGSPVFAYDTSLLSVVEDGALIATLEENDALALPFVEDDRAAALLRGVGTLTSLRSSSEKARAIGLEERGGVIFRRDA